jgi:hypothetical protein
MSEWSPLAGRPGRDSKGRIADIRTFKRAHAMDIKRGSKGEAAKKAERDK